MKIFHQWISMTRRSAQSQRWWDIMSTKESIFEWNSSFSCEIFHLLLFLHECLALHAIPISDTFSSYLYQLYLIFFEKLSRGVMRELASCYVCLLSYYLTTSIVGRFGEEEAKRFSFRSRHVGKASLSAGEKLSLRNMKILERKCCMIQSIRQLLHRQHLLHLPRDRRNIF
jgi:hypothetical protein